MKAMVLKKLTRLEENPTPLEFETLPDPIPSKREILIKVSACGVCRTELDEIEGRTPPTQFPIVLGHQVVGRVVELGAHANTFKLGDRVGVAWILSACGQCKFCLRGEENLCYDFRATGRDAHGGYAEYMTVSEGFAYPIPEIFSDIEAAPLLCAGAIGYRSLRLTNLNDGQDLGLTGFGASGHLVLQLVRYLYPSTKIFVFARSETERAFARELGAVWAGDIGAESPEKLDAIMDTTPVWQPIVESLKNLERGGRLIVNAIRKEDSDKNALTQLDYTTHLWLEKELKSVANVTRRDVREFLGFAAKIPIKPEVQVYKLEEANQALLDLKARKIRGAKVLKIE
ncbi:zinc-dependent alcohol dehydrogenase family protein [Candidatus Acetothermia bacterium]|jgi:propanol-preferring alcohol dehydrogenase|nr:zinc-dependent alcohol dehydrogenase family protein [Candidatus Acetothermia bacterium]MCI2432461.1 zinc-dependent alcohol dehydrogenase family protein [Candidatus Acetothermia bacterium]MCI2437099.1 zinc-dependent alcohol dehydrogenase family protein [Candidatus Acetothermia bacterium]